MLYYIVAHYIMSYSGGRLDAHPLGEGRAASPGNNHVIYIYIYII